MASENAQIKELIVQGQQNWDEYRKSNDARLEELKKTNYSRVQELDHKLEKMDVALTEAMEQKRRLEVSQQNDRERIEELEARAKTPGKSVIAKLENDYEEKFMRYLRSGLRDPRLAAEVYKLEADIAIERKDVTVGTASQGGAALPKAIATEIERQEKLFSPVTIDCSFQQVGTTDYHQLVDLTGASSGWVGETGSRTATNTPALRDVTPTWGENYAYPQASQWSLDDLFFDVQGWLTQAVADCFAVDLGTAVVSGNGTTKPTGMINSAPTLIDDFASPLRGAAVYQYVASLATPDALLADSLIDVQFKLNSRYRQGAKYIFNSTTAGQIRKLKDTTNQYLWQPSMQAGTPEMLLGYPISIWEQMQTVTQGAGSLPVAFGNFKRGYLIAQRVGMRIVVDQVTNPGYVRFYLARRIGGIPLNNNAIKFIKTT